jgi:enterochelin esterase-like enzyme
MKPIAIRIPYLLAVCALLSLAQNRRPPAQWQDPDKSEPADTRYETFSSKLAGGEVSYLIYLPPGYQTATEKRYPVVYWLHGLGGNPQRGAKFVTELNRAIRTSRTPAMIAVLVNGMRDGFYCDSPDGKWPVESVIIKELIPHIDRTYRTIASREARAVEGYSMGGYGAAHLGFKYPEVFGIVGVMAGALLDADSLASRHSDILQKMFGNDKEYYLANRPSTLVEKNAEAIRGRTAIRIAVGDKDPLQPRNQAFHELLQRLKIEHEYEVVPGVAHNNVLFYQTLGYRAFAHYAKALERVVPGSRGRRPFRQMAGQSRVLQRGDLEILTFETEQDYDRLQQLYRESQSSSPKPGTKTTQYFRSPTDGSVQPYALWLPRDYSPAKTYPLLVQLHGLNFNKVLGAGQRIKFRGLGSEQNPWFEPYMPVILAQVFGRQSTFYQGMGEEDILETVTEVRRRFSVDPDRVFLMGHSMGGAGSFTVGLHYPDRFGGILPMDPAMGRRLAPQENIPAWMKPQVAIQMPASLYPNGRNIDVFFKNAVDGIQGNSREFTDGIVAEGGFSTTEAFPNMPHNFGNFYPYAMFVPEAVLHPIRRLPAEVRFYTNTLRYNQAYWVTIDRLTRHNADARVVATYDDGKPAAEGAAARPPTLTVTTTNIDALTLRVPGTEASLIVDGRQVHPEPLPETVHLSRQSGIWRIGEPARTEGAKRHGVQGPIGDAFNSKFLAVYGEGDRDLAIAELDAIRNPPGPLTIAGDFPMKEAGKVTAEDVKSSNLILFGAPASNSVLKRIAPSLPASLLQPGTVFIYPNPENPDRYVVVWNAKILSAPDNGLRAGYILPVNLLPDYIRVKDGKVVSGGHFDSDWKLAGQ